MRTDDGFEYETVKELHRVVCTCTKDGRSAIVTWTPPPGKTTDILPHTEQIERQAREVWIAVHDAAARGLLGDDL